MFRREQIDRYGDVMIDAAEHVSADWDEGAAVDINREMTRVALRVVGRTIFDADVESEAPEIAAVLDAGMRVFHRFLLPGAGLLWRLPLPATRQFNAAKRDIDRFLDRLVAGPRRRRRRTWSACSWACATATAPARWETPRSATRRSR